MKTITKELIISSVSLLINRDPSLIYKSNHSTCLENHRPSGINGWSHETISTTQHCIYILKAMTYYTIVVYYAMTIQGGHVKMITFIMQLLNKKSTLYMQRLLFKDSLGRYLQVTTKTTQKRDRTKFRFLSQVFYWFRSDIGRPTNKKKGFDLPPASPPPIPSHVQMEWRAYFILHDYLSKIIKTIKV